MKGLYLVLLTSISIGVGELSAEAKNVSKTWLDFVENQAKGKVSIIPDYSYAGYHFAEKGVKDVEAKVFNVCDYGAVAGDGKSDRVAFQKTIAAAANNKGGIIFFPAGRYDLRGENDPNKPIVINTGNIVLRGEGAGKTELFMEFPNPTLDPNKLYASPQLISIKAEGAKTKITDVVESAKQGSFSLKVASTKELKVGDWIALEVKNNDPKFIAEELHPYDCDPKWTDLTKAGNNIFEFHLITAIDGNKLTFKAPIMKEVNAKYGWFIRKYPHIEEVGIEGITFRGNFQEEFKHHKNWLHDGGYTILTMNGVVNSWLRDCDFVDVSCAASIIWSANTSAYNCRILGNVGHSAIRSQGSTRVFLGNIDDQPAQWHSVGVSKPAIGTVIWRVKTAANSCFESHASQPRYTLFDASEGGFMRGRAGGAVKNNPNHLGGLLFWNYNQTNEGQENFDFWAKDTPYWRFVMPLFVGFHSKNGTPSTFVQKEVLLDESHGTPVYPESLFEAQLELRLGQLPQWIKDLKQELYIK